MNLNEVVNLVKDYLKTNKDLSQLLTGAGSFINCYNETTGRVHGKVDTIGANTYRMTHSKPNITQLSKDKEFRELLCVPYNKLLVDVDAGSLELVMMGHYLSKYDNHKYAKIVDSGDKSKGTDVHSVNQRITGLPTRDLAKTFIYACLYGAGEAKIGFMVCKNLNFKYSPSEYNQAVEYLSKNLIKIDGKDYYPVAKNNYTLFDDEMILKTIYGKRVMTRFKDGTNGYNELITETRDLANKDKLYGLDGRKLYPRSSHSAFNLLLQSAGAIYMKHLLVLIDNKLKSKWTYDKEFKYVANIHDAINLEIIPEIKDEVDEILQTSFIETSYNLGLKYPVYGEPHFGKNQWETH